MAHVLLYVRNVSNRELPVMLMLAEKVTVQLKMCILVLLKKMHNLIVISPVSQKNCLWHNFPHFKCSKLVICSFVLGNIFEQLNADHL